MPRQRNPKREKAFNIYKESGGTIKNKHIAEMLEVDEKLVSCWKSIDKWLSVLQSSEISTDKINEYPANKRGAPKGSQHAKGHGPPIKHGIKRPVCWDTLTKQEQMLIESLDFKEESMLQEQIALMTIRERRLMETLKSYREKANGRAVDTVTQTVQYNGNAPGESAGPRAPNSTTITTNTIATFEVIYKLEAELTKLQAKKTRTIEALNRIRIENKKLQMIESPDLEDLSEIDGEIYDKD